MGLCPDQFGLVSKVSPFVVTSHCGLILEMSRNPGEEEAIWLCAVVSLVTRPLNERELELTCFNTSTAHCSSFENHIAFMLTSLHLQMKSIEVVYRNNVNSSLTSTQRPGH